MSTFVKPRIRGKPSALEEQARRHGLARVRIAFEDLREAVQTADYADRLETAQKLEDLLEWVRTREGVYGGRATCCDAPADETEPTKKYAMRHRKNTTDPCVHALRCSAYDNKVRRAAGRG